MPPATGIVLAGGASRRMGTDKRLLPMDGEPMLRRVARTVAASSDELIIAVSADHPLPPGILGDIEARVTSDRRPGAGPLAGVETALEAAHHENVLVVAGDMPWIDGSLLRRLLDRLEATDVDAVAVATDGRAEPLLAAYRRTPSLEMARRLLDAGERRMAALLEALTLETVTAPGRSALNLNKPSDVSGVTA